MSRAVIILPPLLLSRDFVDYPYFVCLGGYQVAAVLRELGWDVSVVDGFARSRAELGLTRDGHGWLGENRRRFLERSGRAARDADLTVINASPFLLSALGRTWLKELVSAVAGSGSGLKVLADMYMGGMHYLEADGNELLDELPELDLVLKYEGERLLGRLAEELESGRRPRRGVWEERESFPLDELVPPAFDLMDVEAYFGFLERVLLCSWRPGPFPAEPARTLPLVTARGCPYGCIFCTRNPGLGGQRRQYRPIPWPTVEDWVRNWSESFALKRLAVLDDVANVDADRFDALLSLLTELDLKVEFPNGLRADRIREDHIERVKTLTGRLKVSLESANPRVQREVLFKNLDPEAVDRVAGWCRKHGLGLDVHVLVGIPGETREEIVETLEMAARFHDEYGAVPLLQFATPLAGTELERICVKQGLMTDPPEDLSACFQKRSLIRTDRFDPTYLACAADALERRVRGGVERKVVVNLTYRCNNRCVFCAVGDRPKRDADTAEVIGQLRHHREEGFDLLDIDGGEPTLHDGLFEVIAQGRRLGYTRVTLTTNGRRLSYEAYARALSRSGVSEVLVSLHAPNSEMQEQLTGEPESFGQTTAGLENVLTAMGDPDAVAVNTTVVRTNLPALRSLGEWLGSLGVRRWNVQVVTPFGRARIDQVPEEEPLREVLTDLMEHPPGSMRIQLINCPPCLVPGYEHVTAGDFGKAEREMIFVGEQGTNLQGFLAVRRKRDERCAGCAYTIVCPGFYVFEPDVPGSGGGQ